MSRAWRVEAFKTLALVLLLLIAAGLMLWSLDTLVSAIGDGDVARGVGAFIGEVQRAAEDARGSER